MTISRLSLVNFRNYAQMRLDVGDGLIILSGENGAGKTNILEAVSLLAPGRGMRRAALRDMARQSGAGDFAVAAELNDTQLGTGISKEQPDRRRTRINGASAPTNDLAEWLSILWLTPAMDRLFIEGASGRRNFLDRLVTALEPSHARNSARYDATRRERNRLLAEERAPEAEWLDALDGQLVQFGSAVAEARARIALALNNVLAKADGGLFAAAELLLDDGGLCDENSICDALSASRQADRAAGRTLRGPHRADLTVLHKTKKQQAVKCSTGEQKALLLSIVIAHADLIAEQRDMRPILLLDEVAAHLDPGRRAILFERLAAKGGQVWLTGTESALFDGAPSNAQRFRVVNGVVQAQ
ncbi:DNA replication/repair protein RecF [Parasphingorhabdus sp.]|uniref:DNA replication/repair protein RecF n=1 Tax=Parasphingorhabdus sp. TaxID=2709688 RepID=UPI003267FC81